jgi:plastocyanin
MTAQKILFLILVVSVVTGCQMYGSMSGTVKGSGYDGGSMGSVAISGFAFSPSSFSFPAAKMVTVTWTNDDSVTHTVTSDTGGLFNATVAPGQTFTYAVPATPGATYSYHCSIHPYMTGSFTAN